MFGEKNPPVNSSCFPNTVLVWLYLKAGLKKKNFLKDSPWMLCILQRLPCPVLKLNTRCSCPRPIGASASDHDVVDPVHSVPLHWDWQGVQSALFFITHFLTCLLSYLHWWSGDQSSTKFIGTTLELKRPPERRRPTTQQI